jgi:hypothetical protein
VFVLPSETSPAAPNSSTNLVSSIPILAETYIPEPAYPFMKRLLGRVGDQVLDQKGDAPERSVRQSGLTWVRRRVGW